VGWCAVVLACALLAAPATAAFAQNGPQPDPDPSAQRSADRPGPDPYQPTAGSDRATSSTATAPDRSPTTPRDGSSSPTEASTTPAPEPAPSPAPTPKVTVDQSTSTTTQAKPPTSRQGPRREAVAPLRPKVRRPAPRQDVKSVVAAVASQTDRRGLLLVGLAPLALALASGSLIFLASRGGPREVRP
jgi:hypothetical protein